MSNIKAKQDQANQETIHYATPPCDKDLKEIRSTPCGVIIPAFCISVACEAENFLLKEKKNLSVIWSWNLNIESELM